MSYFSEIKHDYAYSPRYRGHAFLESIATLSPENPDEAEALA